MARSAIYESCNLKNRLMIGEMDIRQRINLIVSDIEMPKMDGLTLCRKVKDELGYSDVPVLLFSSLINPPMEVKCDSVGADGYAAKPEITKLIEMMDRFIETEPSATPLKT